MKTTESVIDPLKVESKTSSGQNIGLPLTDKPIKGASIVLLDNDVINQIAAGEVVDRPAHLVKELCENSIDAGATELFIEFSNGGRNVLVKDNGVGIRSDELPLALARHATSKIINASDLWAVSSYGFRGEALASIGAVSKMKITSRPRHQEFAAQIECNFGSVGEVVAVGGEYGTSVEVAELFENIPARLKFLKSEAGEHTAIKNQLRAIGLANPEVSIRVVSKNELVFYWPASQSLSERCRQVFEREELYTGANRLEDITVDVVLSGPNDTVKNSRQIWLFVRGRYIQDRALQTAVLEGYRHLLMHGEFPWAAVFLDCDPENIDVNVSPTKSLVKFREPGNAFRAVHGAVKNTLEKAPWLKEIFAMPKPNETSTGFTTEKSASVNSKKSHELNFKFESSEFQKIQMPRKESFAQPGLTMATLRAAFVAPDVKGTGSENSVESDHNELPETNSMPSRWSQLEILGQAHLTYIITQNAESLIFVDQHAAHERVLFERLMHGKEKHFADVQNFLLPVVVDLTEEALQVIMKSQKHWASFGVQIEQFGPAQLAINSSPTFLKESAITKMFHQVAEEIQEMGDSFALEQSLGNYFSTLACHSAVRAGQALSVQEMKELLSQMDEHPLSSFCPHGRPVFVEYPFRKLERDFGRIV